MLANFKGIHNNIIKAVLEANETRKNHISEMIIKRNPKIVGIYRLSMKKTLIISDTQLFKMLCIK